VNPLLARMAKTPEPMEVFSADATLEPSPDQSLAESGTPA